MKQTEALLSRTEESSLGAEAKYDIAYELRVKRRQFNDALVSALGIDIDADVVPATEPNLPAEFRRTQTTFQMAIPGQNIRVKVHVFQAGSTDLSVQDLKLVPSSGKPWDLKVNDGTPENACVRCGIRCDLYRHCAEG